MNTASKVAASALGTGGAVVVGCSVGGVFDGNKETVVEQTSITISWSPLTNDTNFSNTYSTNNTVGKEYGRYWTGIDTANQKWWEEAYKKYESGKSDASSLHKIFGEGKITSAYDNTTTTALNKVCEIAYKKTLDSEVDFSSPSNTSEDKYKLAANILKYCSPLNQMPIVIATDGESYNENTIGKQGNTNNLVSVKDNTNDGFWKAQQEWFKTQGSTQLGNYFGKFFTEVDGTKKLNEDKTIKKICEEAYQQTAQSNGASTADNPTISDVVNYCSFKKTTP